MVTIESQENIKKYYDAPQMNQSSLKLLEHSMKDFLKDQKEKETSEQEVKKCFILGNAVDKLLTGEKFEDSYFISTLDKKPSDVEMAIITQVFSKCPKAKDLTECLGELEQAFIEFEWRKNWKLETKIKYIISAGTEYFQELKNSVGKQILTSVENDTIQSIVSSLSTNPETSFYFNREYFRNNKDNLDLYLQLPIYFEYAGVECKALLDGVITKRVNNVVTEVYPWDLKTVSGETKDFMGNLKRLRYDIQAAYYTEALKKVFPEATIHPFHFIVESTTCPGNPKVFEVSESLLDMGKNGRAGTALRNETDTPYRIAFPVFGFNQLIALYKYYEENDWKEDFETAGKKKDGVIGINWNELEILDNCWNAENIIKK